MPLHAALTREDKVNGLHGRHVGGGLAGAERVEQDRPPVDRDREHCNGMAFNGMQWDATVCNGMLRHVTACDKWNGMSRHVTVWNGMSRTGCYRQPRVHEQRGGDGGARAAQRRAEGVFIKAALGVHERLQSPQGREPWSFRAC